MSHSGLVGSKKAGEQSESSSLVLTDQTGQHRTRYMSLTTPHSLSRYGRQVDHHILYFTRNIKCCQL